jgi:hypothetical protein
VRAIGRRLVDVRRRCQAQVMQRNPRLATHHWRACQRLAIGKVHTQTQLAPTRLGAWDYRCELHISSSEHGERSAKILCAQSMTGRETRDVCWETVWEGPEREAADKHRALQARPERYCLRHQP